MRADYHVHTSFSDDSEYAMENVVRDAVDMGLDEICFTDHVDYSVKRDKDDARGIEYRKGGRGEPELIPLMNVDYEAYYSEYLRVKEKYGSKIRLRLGLEFGVQSHTIGDYLSLFPRYPFDFIILSVHQVGDREFWNGEYQKGRTQKEYNEGYYEEMLKVIEKYKAYSVLGHLDLITRYDSMGRYPFEKVKPLVTSILKRAIADGKGIEINTSSRRYGLEDTPSRDILKLYRELGGEIITIGSDSHRREHLGAYIDESRRLLRDLGYRYFCTFERMKPVFNPL